MIANSSLSIRVDGSSLPGSGKKKRSVYYDEKLDFFLELQLHARDEITPDQASRLLKSPALSVSAELGYIADGVANTAHASGSKLSSKQNARSIPLTPLPQPVMDATEDDVQYSSRSLVSIWQAALNAAAEVKQGQDGQWFASFQFGCKICAFRLHPAEISRSSSD